MGHLDQGRCRRPWTHSVMSSQASWLLSTWESKSSPRPSGLPQACGPITKCFLPWRFSDISGSCVFIVCSPKLSPYQTQSSDSKKIFRFFPLVLIKWHVPLQTQQPSGLSPEHPRTAELYSSPPRCPHARLTPSRAAPLHLQQLLVLLLGLEQLMDTQHTW